MAWFPVFAFLFAFRVDGSRSPSLHAVVHTPVDRIRCSLVGELRVPARVSSLSMQPSPLSGRVGVHITVQPTTFLEWVLPSPVTCAIEAHPITAFLAAMHLAGPEHLSNMAPNR